MQDAVIEAAVELDMSLGESPVWSVKHQTLYWVDINKGHVYAWAPQSQSTPKRVELREKIGSLALCEDGLLAAMASGIVRLRFPFDGQPELLAANPEWQAGRGNRFNDGRCDGAGRFWVGTMDADEQAPSAALYCLDGQQLERRLGALAISNGLAFSPDNRFLYHTDSPSRRLLRYPFDMATGAFGEPQTWVDLDALGLPGVCDGGAVDSEGCYWSALYGGGRVVRFSPQGELLENLELPCPHPTMVAFGGPELKTLYITTATQHLDDESQARWPLAGSLLQIALPVSGQPEPCFGVKS